MARVTSLDDQLHEITKNSTELWSKAKQNTFEVSLFAPNGEALIARRNVASGELVEHVTTNSKR